MVYSLNRYPIYEGGVAPAFGQPGGGGTQYCFFDSIQELLNAESLEGLCQ